MFHSGCLPKAPRTDPQCAGSSSGLVLTVGRAQEVPEQNRFANVIDLITASPVDPNVLQDKPTRIVQPLHGPQNLPVVDGVFFEGCLDLTLAGASYMKMRGVGEQRLDFVVRNALIDKMGVVERQRQSLRHADELLHLGGRGSDAADVSLH